MSLQVGYHVYAPLVTDVQYRFWLLTYDLPPVLKSIKWKGMQSVNYSKKLFL